MTASSSNGKTVIGNLRDIFTCEVVGALDSGVLRSAPLKKVPDAF